MAAPVTRDEELDLQIDSLAYGGNGVARLNGFVVFVRRGLPGDRVRARVTKVKRSHAEALTLEVLEPGAARVDAPCAHYPACGGCRFQDLAYEAQHRGFLRHLVVREGRNTGQALVVLVTGPGELRGRDEFVAALTRFPEVRSIHRAVNAGAAEVTNLPTELLHGDDAIEEEFLGLRFRVRPSAFLQTNTAMAERLYELAGEYAGLTGAETVYDLYCGIGTIGLSLARDALTVWGVEVSEESVACALENADLNGITNAAFFAGEVGASLEELAARAGPPDVAVVDPPRAGLAGKALRRLARLEAPKIVYVSCNPTTLASNVKDLERDWGYRLERARPLDMFPHTPHIETVALLARP